MRPNIFILLCLTSINFSTHSKISTKSNYYTKQILPGCVQISENLFCDRFEVTNYNWLEYMYWTLRVYGEESPKYQSCKPDALVWTKLDAGLTFYTEMYLRHPTWQNHPVVGISQKQAEDFSKWRSDRVFEFILIKNNILEWNPDQHEGTHFTIERYFNSEHLEMVPDKEMLYYPHYSLPSIDNWMMALNFSDSLNHFYLDRCHSDYCKQCLSMYPDIYADIKIAQLLDSTSGIYATTPVDRQYIPHKKNSIYNLLGNVAEWTSADDVAIGGGWYDNKTKIIEGLKSSLKESNAWTGFRNVCVWKKWVP